VRVGDLSARQDFVDVRDVAQAVTLALALPGRLPRLLNIGSGRAAPARDLARGLADAAGFTGDVEETLGAAGRPTAAPWQCSDVTAAEWELGWRPRFTLRESLAALWASDGDPRLAPATGSRGTSVP
jgi:nucleoside-diphosphate-sugar epimerase